MSLDPGDVYFDGMCDDATRILAAAGLWRNHAPAGNPVSSAPAASVATTNAGSNPVDMHH